MSKYDLSILIPARNEEFLDLTVRDLIKNIRGKTEVIVVLDGYKTKVVEAPNVTVLHNEESIGQRAATNQAAKISEAKYLMKVDAHCAFDEGFDVKMMEEMQDNWTMIPVMRNLWVYDWKCYKCGKRVYQDKQNICPDCGHQMKKKILWIPKTNPSSTSYCFDQEPHFQYFNDYKRRPEGKGELTESMSIQGSCFMLTREKYWELNICDESLGSWGSQGIEVACKTWLSGGKVICNQKTWYAHMFRTKGENNFGFPYPISGRQTNHAKSTVRELFFDNKWDKQIHPLSWLLEKFWPVPGWSEEMRQKIKDWPLPTKPLGELSVGILYYTDNELDPEFLKRVQDQIKLGIGNYKLVSVSLKPIDFGENIVLPIERSKLAMHKQILAGLKKLDTDIVFFCESDVYYHPSHFDFRPFDKNIYYYNNNLWRVRKLDGFAVKYDHKSLSQICAYREKLIPEYEHRVAVIEKEGFNRHFTHGYEPGTRSLRLGGFSDDGSESWNSEYPNLDIRHDKNLSASKWRQEDFKSHRSCRNWQESTLENIKGWEGFVV